MELSDGGTDFASTFGVGGVIGTNFAWPGAPGKKDAKLLLTPEREQLWAKWTKLYAEKRLSEGEYLGGLYDIGFDRPEAHVVRKDGALFYAFFAQELRRRSRAARPRAGRPTGSRDYVGGRDLGRVAGPTGELETRFEGSLLLEVKAWTH